jgi:hypothetical protein
VNKLAKSLVVVVTSAILALVLLMAFGDNSSVLPPANARLGLLSMLLCPILLIAALNFFVLRPESDKRQVPPSDRQSE